MESCVCAALTGGSVTHERLREANSPAEGWKKRVFFPVGGADSCLRAAAAQRRPAAGNSRENVALTGEQRSIGSMRANEALHHGP